VLEGNDLWLTFAVSYTPVDLITWRAARRFGGRGLAVFALAGSNRPGARPQGRRNVPRLALPFRRASRRFSPSVRSMHCW